jgi:hypothetical protein
VTIPTPFRFCIAADLLFLLPGWLLATIQRLSARNDPGGASTTKHFYHVRVLP